MSITAGGDVDDTKKRGDNRLDIISNILKFTILNRCVNAIDTMLNDKSSIDSISIEHITLDDIYERFDPEHVVFAVYIKGIGDIMLTLLLVIEVEDGKKLASILISNAIDGANVDELTTSAIAEFGNILLAGAFTNALTHFTGFNINCTAPGYAKDSLASILEYIVADSDSTEFIYADGKLSFVVNKDLVLHISVLIPINDAKRLVDVMLIE
ncbi:CheY-P phosphatase CheC [archaeon HR05]|nr:CheY-P phosphatase CheC [archaeon HR05]